MAMSDVPSHVPGDALPRWELDTLFPGPTSPQFRAALDDATRRIVDLTALFHRHGLGVRSPDAGAAALAAFEEVVAAYDATLRSAYRLDGYISCLTAADTQDEAARAAESAWRETRTRLVGLAPRFVAWVAALDSTALAASEVARDHESVLRRLDVIANHLMPSGEEELAALLGPSGATAWMTLSEEMLSQASVCFVRDGEARELPLSEIDNLAYDPNRDVRRRGQEAAQAARRTLAVPLAAALNGVKAQQSALARRRGWDDPLDQALFANAIDRSILDAMFAVMQEALPDYRRYLRAKALALGLPVLAGYDLLAPVGELVAWPYDAACAFVVAAFTAFDPGLGAFAERAFAESWLDVGPRFGKEGGAFCTGVGGDASRILLNYLPVSGWMSTIAHELGHAYHNFVIDRQGRTFLQASPDCGPAAFPLTMAETASTLCEILALRAAAENPRSAEPIGPLDEWLQSFTLSTFGIMPMLAFERDVFAARAERELAPTEMEALMAATWREVAGDAIDPETVWSHTWTMSHFIGDTDAYYNFPYAFGMLFALGLLAEREANPDGFRGRFDALLADAGMCEARELAAEFGIDLAAPAFWRAAFDAFRDDVDRFEELAEGLRAPG